MEMPDITISDREIDRALQNLQMKNAVLTHIDDRPAQPGDHVTLNLRGTIGGKPFPGSRRSHFSMTIGEDRYLPGLDEAVTGRAAGDRFQFSLEIPDLAQIFRENQHTEDYRKLANLEPFSGMTADFSAAILSLGILELPKLDDDFALDFSECDTLDELKEELCLSLEEKKEEQETERVKQHLLTQIINASVFDLNENILADLKKEYIAEFEERLKEQSLTAKEYFRRTDRTMADIEADCRRRAVRSLSETMVLAAIGDRERISLTSDELESALYDMADCCEMEYEEFLASLDEDEIEGIRLELLCDKAMELVLEEAIYI